MSEALVCDAVRLPRARLRKEGGAYARVRPVELLAPLYRALLERNGLQASQVESVVLGCSTASGAQGADVARVSALYAGLPDSVHGAVVSSFCCSGLDAIASAAGQLKADMVGVVLAGGVESLSQVPMFSDNGDWFAEPEVARRTGFLHMGLAADLVAVRQGYSRAELEAYAVQSHARAAEARRSGAFQRSLVPVRDGEGRPLLAEDDGVREGTSLESLARLPPSFAEAGARGGEAVIRSRYPEVRMEYRHTAGTAPLVADGASLLLLATPERAAALGLKARARVRAWAQAADEPVRMLTGHLRATEALLKRAGLAPEAVELWEVNESFAAPTLLYRQHFRIAPERFNVHGGALALGHPLGATGGNLVSTLVDEMERREARYGVAALCGAAGLGTAVLLERG